MNYTTMLEEIENYASCEDVPIMQKSGIDFLTNYIEKNNIKTILEIGTAIGYSAIKMALINPNIKIVSIERDQKRYLEAVNNIKRFHLEDRITLVFKDAIDFETNEKFDLLFIDAAKGKNKEFFEKFKKNLKDDSTIITDNIEFHGFVQMDEKDIKSRNLRGLVRKIKDYIKFLKENTEYKTEFYSIGDGIAVTKKM